MIPGERRREGGRPRRRWVLALLAAAAAGGLLHLSGVDVAGGMRSAVEVVGAWVTDGPPGGGGPAARGDPGAGGSVPAGATPDSAAPTSSAPARGDPSLRRLRERAGALDEAIGRFRERAVDFERGRIGCPALAEGYGAVDRSMVELARAWLEARQQVAPGDEALFQRALARADSAGRAFDATGCARTF